MTGYIRDFDCPEVVFTPNNEQLLIDELRRVIDPKQWDRKYNLDIGKSILTIKHKMNVAMHQGALICSIDPSQYLLFKNSDIKARELESTYALYKSSLFIMNNIDEYRLFISFFIESYTASVFSLFDVVGSLLKSLYDFTEMDSSDVSYSKSIDEYARKRQKDDFYDFLLSYKPLNKTEKDPSKTPNPRVNKPIINPLASIRHITTHRPITDVCEIPYRENLYGQISPDNVYFVINKNIIQTGITDNLYDFVNESFKVLQEFIDELYERLADKVCSTGGLPIY